MIYYFNKINFILGIEEAIKEKLINVENQRYIICNSKTNEEINWKNAIEENLMIGCEVKESLITPEYLKCLKASLIDENMNLEDIDIIGVVNTLTGEIVETDQAIDAQLLDLNTCLFFDTENNTWLCLNEAVKYGFVLAKIKQMDTEVHRVLVKSVKCGNDQSDSNLKEAIENNCIDQLENTYSIEEMNLSMRLIDAVMCGLIILEENQKMKDNDKASWMILQRNADDPEIEDLCKHEINEDINLKILCKAQQCECMNEFLTFDDVKEKLCESIYQNHLTLDPILCGRNEKKSILLGCVKDEISVENLERLLENIKEMFVGKLVDGLDKISSGNDIMDKLTEKDIDDSHKNMLAIEYKTFTITSVSHINKDNKNDQYVTNIEPSKLIEKLNQLKCLETFGIDTTENVFQIKDKDTNDILDTCLFEALMKDNINLNELEFLDSTTGEMCTLNESVDKGLLDVKTAEKILNCMESMSFDNIMKNGIYNVESNSFGDCISLEKAVETNMLKPELVYLSEIKNNKLTNLCKLLEDKVLNPLSNEIEMRNEKGELETIPLNEALNPETEIFATTLNCEEMKRQLPKKLKDLLECKAINKDKDLVRFDELANELIPVDEAMKKHLLNEESYVKVAPCEGKDENNEIIYCGNVDIVDLIKDLDEFSTILEEYLLDAKVNKKVDVAKIEVNLVFFYLNELIEMFNLGVEAID